MPFWWRRRRKPWYGRWRRRRYQRYKRRKPRRRFTRRRNRKTTRRRRKRKYKVRRKRQKIPVMQWQPDSIRKCTIKGLGLLVLGAEGNQIDCYTTDRYRVIPPRVSSGGGFGVEKYTLSYLYEEYRFKQNIWTHTNIGKDLCRYLGCRLTFYRHLRTDFIVAYDRQPPWDINKWTFPSCHPQQLLLEKHKVIVLSKTSKTNSKYKVIVKIKPPKQMITKWFFTKPFSQYGLMLLKGAAADMNYSYMAGKAPNRCITIKSLNTKFYVNTNWAVAYSTGRHYLPYSGIPSTLQLKLPSGSTESITITESNALNYDQGYFSSKLLKSQIIASTVTLAVRPVITARYNPAEDTGEGNQIYIISTLQEHWDAPRVDKSLVLEGVPLWLGLFGIYSYLKSTKTLDFLLQCMCVVKSKAIRCDPEIGGCDLYCVIDQTFIDGKKPGDLPISAKEKRLWFPDMYWQHSTLNAIIESGPYTPKYSEELYSTWELKYKYNFYFKWGGPQLPEAEVKNPQQLQEYNVPDTVFGRIQITNPEKQATETIFHPWDTRRGFIKESALKRMYEHLETDTDFEPDAEMCPKKKKKILGAALRHPQEEEEEIQACLLSLCEKDTCQDKEQTVEQLIQQQKLQQQQLKYNMLKLLFELKEKQRQLQLQTGLLE
nr:MAG: ORF1 [Torque teno midi virus]UHK05095.1 MAG: ORF1 [Torque teno midi virus]UHK05103.1 MAG: ORF1 [Torque teno midi virus]